MKAYTAYASKTVTRMLDGVDSIVQSRDHYKFTNPRTWAAIDMSG